MVTLRHLRGCHVEHGCLRGCPVAEQELGYRDAAVAFGYAVTVKLRRARGEIGPGRAADAGGVSRSLLRWRDKKAEGRCRMCLRPSDVRPLTEHHVVPVSWFSGSRLRPLRNVAANKVPLCREDHDLVERDEHARRELRRLLAPDEVAFAIQTAGRAWLDARYPTVRRAG